jgi:hypothetical protein
MPLALIEGQSTHKPSPRILSGFFRSRVRQTTRTAEMHNDKSLLSEGNILSRIHLSLPIALPVSSAFSLERPVRSPDSQGEPKPSITTMIPVQRLAKIREKKPPMPCHAIPLPLPAPPLDFPSYCSQDATRAPEAVRVPWHRRLPQA